MLLGFSKISLREGNFDYSKEPNLAYALGTVIIGRRYDFVSIDTDKAISITLPSVRLGIVVFVPEAGETADSVCFFWLDIIPG